MPKKKKIQLVLLGLLLVASVGIVLRFKYQAFTEPTYVVKGFVFSKEDNRSLPGVTVTLSDSFTGAEGASTYTATTDARGSYFLNIPTSLKWGSLSFTKDGFFDAEGLFDFTDFNESSHPAAYTYIDLKPGFGKEVFVAKFLPQGFSSLSFPFTPLSANPQEVFTFKNISDDSEGDGVVFQDQPFLTDYSKFKLKFYYQGSQKNPVEYKPSQGLEITAGNGYYFQNDSTDSLNHHVLVVKGKELQEDFSIDLNYPVSNCPAHIPGGPVRQCVPSPAEPIDTSIANPFMKEVSTDELQIIDTWDANKEYSLNEAIEANLIDKNLKVRIGLGASDFKPPIDLTSGPQDLTPTVGGWLLKDNRGGLRVKFPLIEDSDRVELPLEISADAAKWAFWTNPETLSDQDLATWHTVIDEIDSSIPYNLQSQIVDPESEVGIQDGSRYFVKDGKIIPSMPPDGEEIPPSPNSFQSKVNKAVSGVTESSSQNRVWRNGECKTINKISLCFIYEDETIPWGTDMVNTLLNEFQAAYPIIEKYFGPPIFSNSENELGYKLITVELVKDWPFSGEYINEYNRLKINNKDFTDPATSHNDKITVFIHELIHGWRDDRSPLEFGNFLGEGWSGKYGKSWEEGQVRFVEVKIASERGVENQSTKSYQIVETDYYERNSPILTTTNNKSWANRFIRTYDLSAVAWSQIYAQDNDFFKKFNQKLAANIRPDKAFKDVLPEGLVDNEVKKVVGSEPYDKWYARQWAGLTQDFVNKYVGNQIYKFAYHETSKTGQAADVIKILNRSGANERVKSKYRWELFKSFADAQGVKKTILVNSGSSPVDNRQLKLDNNTELNPQKKYTFVNRIIANPGTKEQKRYAPTNVYMAVPGPNACIYGIVAEAYNASITVTPVKPANSPKSFDVRDGYFEITNSDMYYGCEAGTYKITYQPLCGGKPRDYFITKPKTTDFDGRRFLPIKTGKSTVPSQTFNSSNSFVSRIINFVNRGSPGINVPAASATDEICYLDELKIQDIKSETQADGSEKVTFKTSRPTFAYAVWGETSSYDQETEMSNEASTGHQLIFSPVSAGTTYHFNIIAVDATGKSEPDGSLAESEEEEDFDQSDSTESGDQTFIPCPSITNIQVSNISSTAAQVSWTIEPGEPTALKYGTDPANLDKSAEVNSSEISQSVTLSNLTPNTTYHYRVEPKDQPDCGCSPS